MEIIEISSKEYAGIFNEPYFCYGSAAFNMLNMHKCEEILFLLFRNEKNRLGLIGGVTGNIFSSPFSAPFGGFSYVSRDIKLQHIEESIKVLLDWAKKRNISEVHVTLPPVFYDDTFISKQFNCLFRNDFVASVIDLNYALDLRNFDENYTKNIWYNARKNLRISTELNLTFTICEESYCKELAYNIIKTNRESKGYPLRLSWEQVNDTIKIFNADFFLISNENTPIASAVVFHINKHTVQIIYWGDTPGYSEFKPMNFLSFKLFEYYRNSDVKFIDIGPSTENSIPNYGVCEFKEGIGCRIDSKIGFTYNVK